MKRNYEFHEWNELNFATKVANWTNCGLLHSVRNNTKRNPFVPIWTLASQILLSHSHNLCNS